MFKTLTPSLTHTSLQSSDGAPCRARLSPGLVSASPPSNTPGNQVMGWGFSSVAEHLPTTYKALSLIPNNTKTKQTQQPVWQTKPTPSPSVLRQHKCPRAEGGSWYLECHWAEASCQTCALPPAPCQIWVTCALLPPGGPTVPDRRARAGGVQGHCLPDCMQSRLGGAPRGHCTGLDTWGP